MGRRGGDLMRLAGATCVLFAGLSLAHAADEASAVGQPSPRPVRFNRDIRPILAEHCLHCHGPDANSRQAELRLDWQQRRDGIAGVRQVVEAGDLDSSVLWQRVTHDDVDTVMPPPEAKKPLSNKQLSLLRQWILEGAVWEEHWAFQTPQRPAVPVVTLPDLPANAVQNPIDAFVIDELQREGWRPTAAANPETLVRRVTLDLTGLPPTPDEVQAYLNDTSPQRYEQLVDRLLASARYGEQMAVTWLDAARYSDTSGYQSDGPREMWRWRDWVIDAYNAGMPFDQFTVEQLAGDLLPGATLNQQIATGFHRNHRGNAEGGIIPEEYAVEYVADRVDTTGTVWLGLTIGCARCHDHKFDPLSQRDYYRFFAYFNNVPEFGRAIKEGNSPPYLLTPTPLQQQQLKDLDAQLAAAAKQWQALQGRLNTAQTAWEQQLLRDVVASDDQQQQQRKQRDWTVTAGLQFRALAADVVPGDLEPPTVAPAPVEPPLASVTSPAGPGLALDGSQFLEFGDRAKFGYFDSFSVSVWVRPRGTLTGGLVTKMTDDSDSDGWALHLEQGRLQVNLVKRWLDDSLRVETTSALNADAWQHVAFTYDGSRVAKGVTIYVNGEPQPLAVKLDLLNQTMANSEPLRLGSTGTQSRLQGDLGDARIYERALEPWEVRVLATANDLPTIARLPVEMRSAGQREKLQQAFLERAAPPELKQPWERLRQLEAQRRAFVAALPTTMTMQDSARPARAAILKRGEYDQPGELVSPGVPDALQLGSGSVGENRLALARWIVDPQHPLTARVAVNREWQRFFGIGLVKTSEDFGTQAEPPSHPELLDWLAIEFVQSGWDVKRLQRLIVTSATYRQATSAEPSRFAADPENRRLARGPRFRLSAETLRDQALAAAGLLQEELGGPSFYPYLPDGLWSEIATTTQYERSTGRELHRRTLYSYGKRTVSNPTLAAFDAPPREACSVRRVATNTPLQALTLLNDVTFVEAARVLAERACEAADATVAGRLSFITQQVLGREPTPTELRILTAGYAWQQSRWQQTPEQAQQFVQTGDAAVTATLPAADLAALTLMASLILNLDEAVTRE